MVYVSKSGKISDMATPGPGHPMLNDSLESSDWLRAKASVVEPESYPGEEVDVNAFNHSSEDTCFGIFPGYIINLINDQSNWKNRTVGIAKMQSVINDLPDRSPLQPHLDLILKLATATVNDSHFKVSQMGLELVACIVAKACNHVQPYLPHLVHSIILKVGSNKFVLKQAGMRVLMELMIAVRPQPVVKEIIRFGFGYKTSRVREESLNSIIAALLTFPKSEFSFPSIISDIGPLMADSKSRVRQASLETIALICNINPSAVTDAIKSIVEVRTKTRVKYDTQNGLTLMDAFQTRFARKCIPKLNAHGLVEHAIVVANTKPPYSIAGADVDWILSAGGVKSQASNEVTEHPEASSLAQARQRKPSAGAVGASSSRPYRSAGKRLPWEVEGEDMIRSHLTPQPKELAPLSTPLATSPKHPPFSPAPGSPTQATPRKTSYTDMYLAKMGSSQKPLSHTHSHPPTTHSLAAVHPPNGHGGLGLHRNSIGSMAGSNERGPPLFTPRHASVSDDHTQMMNPNASMSVTWPRSGGGVTMMRASNQISADAVKVTGGVHSSVKTNVSRPLSKPRVRNPLSSLKHQPTNQNPAHRDSPTQLEKEFLSSANGGTEGVAMPTGWGDTSWDEEYFRTIPEDMTILNSSLSSSLSSLCAGRDLDSAKAGDTSDVDKLKHIRKEAASRKAQLISAATSASNSPECSRQSSGEARRPSQQGDDIGSISAPTKKSKRTKPITNQSHSIPSHLNATFNGPSTRWPSEDNSRPNHSQNVSLNKTYTPGNWDHDNNGTYTAVFAAKKLGTPPKSLKTFNQSKRERENGHLAEGSKVISLEGCGLGSDINGTVRDSQTKKKSRKLDPSRNYLPPPKGKRLQDIDREGADMIDMEVNGVGDTVRTTNAMAPVQTRRQQKEQSYSNKTQSATYPSLKKPPIPPVRDNAEPAASAPPENIRKRSKHKKISPPLKRQAESGYSTAGDDTPRSESYGGHRHSVSSDMESSFNSSPEGSLQELQPYPSPEQGLKESLVNIDNEDWNLKVEGMIGVRRVTLYHPEVLLPRLQTVVFAVQKEVKNLRSSVARGAIACMGDLFATMRSSMEKDLDSVVKVLLHKGSESNTFIREDVEKALCEMTNNLSHHKCLISLINGGLTHRNTQVRKVTSKHVCLILEAQGPSRFLHSSKDLLDRTLPAIIQLATDNSPEARYYGKRCLHQLWPLADFEKVSSRVLTGTLSNRAKELIESLKTKGLGDPPVESHSAKGGSTSNSRHSTGGTVRASMQKSLSHQSSYADGPVTKEAPSKKTRRQHSTSNPPDYPEVPLPDGLLDHLKASNWSERLDGVTELEEFVSASPMALAPHLHKVFDAFCPRLTDRNSKVNLRALEVFSNIVPLLCDTLTPVTTNIVNALVPNLASRNATIHSNAMTALDLLSQCIDPVHLIQPVANSGQFGNARVRPIMINKLADLTMDVFAQKPQMISRQVLPVMCHLVSSKSPLTGDTRTASLALCDALISTLGSSFTEGTSHLSPESRKKLDDLISSLNR